MTTPKKPAAKTGEKPTQYAAMTNRESFAQAAMIGFLRSPYWNMTYPDPTSEPTRTAMLGLAEISVAMADMLIAELARPVPNK